MSKQQFQQRATAAATQDKAVAGSQRAADDLAILNEDARDNCEPIFSKFFTKPQLAKELKRNQRTLDRCGRTWQRATSHYHRPYGALSASKCGEMAQGARASERVVSATNAALYRCGNNLRLMQQILICGTNLDSDGQERRIR